MMYRPRGSDCVRRIARSKKTTARNGTPDRYMPVTSRTRRRARRTGVGIRERQLTRPHSRGEASGRPGLADNRRRMAEDARAPEAPAHSSHVADVLLGARGGIASTVYGTVLVMATLSAAYASEHDTWRLAVVVATTAFVLWIAHLYSHALSESIAHDHRLTRGDVTGIAQRELGILLAA